MYVYLDRMRRAAKLAGCSLEPQHGALRPQGLGVLLERKLHVKMTFHGLGGDLRTQHVHLLGPQPQLGGVVWLLIIQEVVLLFHHGGVDFGRCRSTGRRSAGSNSSTDQRADGGSRPRSLLKPLSEKLREGTAWYVHAPSLSPDTNHWKAACRPHTNGHCYGVPCRPRLLCGVFLGAMYFFRRRTR